jgi:DNA-binding IscR family transcriptional regulator
LLPACTLKSVLAQASRNFLSTLDRYTLQDVLGSGIGSMFAHAKGARILIKSVA